MTNDEALLKFTADKLEELSGRIQDCLGKLTPEQIWTRNSDNENAVGNLVLHLCGNLRQWIGSGVAGKPDIRDRDSEFAARGGLAAADLATRLNAVVGETAAIIRGVTAARLAERTVPQGYNVTVLEAIVHVMEHFAYHTGQVVFATKLLTGEDLGYFRHLSGSGRAAPARLP